MVGGSTVGVKPPQCHHPELGKLPPSIILTHPSTRQQQPEDAADLPAPLQGTGCAAHTPARQRAVPAKAAWGCAELFIVVILFFFLQKATLLVHLTKEMYTNLY